MDYYTITYKLDESVPHIGVVTLSPTPFIILIRSIERFYEESSVYSEEKID